MPLPVKTHYVLREPKICATRDIAFHIVYDSAIAAFQHVIDKMIAVAELELWAIATDQCGFVITEWLIYSYSRGTNRLSKHGASCLGKEKTNAKEPKTPNITPRVAHVLDPSGHWEEIPDMDLSISY